MTKQELIPILKDISYKCREIECNGRCDYKDRAGRHCVIDGCPGNWLLDYLTNKTKGKDIFATLKKIKQTCLYDDCCWSWDWGSSKGKICDFKVDGHCVFDNVPEDWDIERLEREVE